MNATVFGVQRVNDMRSSGDGVTPQVGLRRVGRLPVDGETLAHDTFVPVDWAAQRWFGHEELIKVDLLFGEPAGEVGRAGCPHFFVGGGGDEQRIAQRHTLRLHRFEHRQDHTQRRLGVHRAATVDASLCGLAGKWIRGHVRHTHSVGMHVDGEPAS